MSSAPPFYVIAYPHADALRDMVVSWEGKEFEEFLSTLPDEKGKRQIQIGVKRFERYSKQEREKVWTLLAEGVLPYFQKYSFSIREQLYVSPET